MEDLYKTIFALSDLCRNHLKSASKSTPGDSSAFTNPLDGLVKHEQISNKEEQPLGQSLKKEIKEEFDNVTEIPPIQFKAEGEKQCSSNVFECCGKKFRYVSLYQRHQKSIAHSKDSFKCNLCKEKFQSEESLQVHQEDVHSKIGSVFVCQLCGKEFLGRPWLVRHTSTVHGSGLTSKCDYCDYSTVRRDLLKRHIQRRHLNTPKSYPCSQCDMLFQTKIALITHTKTVHDKKRYQCLKCFRTFSSEPDVHIHMKCHEPGRNYLCMVCGKAFQNFSHRERHLRTHIPSMRPTRVKTEKSHKRAKTSAAVEENMKQYSKFEKKNAVHNSLSKEKLSTEVGNGEGQNCEEKWCDKELEEERNVIQDSGSVMETEGNQSNLNPEPKSVHVDYKNQIEEIRRTHESFPKEKPVTEVRSIQDPQFEEQFGERNIIHDSGFVERLELNLPNSYSDSESSDVDVEDKADDSTETGEYVLPDALPEPMPSEIFRAKSTSIRHKSSIVKIKSFSRKEFFCSNERMEHIVPQENGGRETSGLTCTAFYEQCGLSLSEHDDIKTDLKGQCKSDTPESCHSYRNVKGNFRISGRKPQRCNRKASIRCAPQFQSSFGKENEVNNITAPLNIKKEFKSPERFILPANLAMIPHPVSKLGTESVLDNCTRDLQGVISERSMKVRRPKTPKQSSSDQLRKISKSKKNNLPDAGPRVYIKNPVTDENDVFVLPEFFTEDDVENVAPEQETSPSVLVMDKELPVISANVGSTATSVEGNIISIRDSLLKNNVIIDSNTIPTNLVCMTPIILVAQYPSGGPMMYSHAII